MSFPFLSSVYLQVFTPVRIYLLIAKVPTKVSIVLKETITKKEKIIIFLLKHLTLNNCVFLVAVLYSMIIICLYLFQIECHFHYLDIQAVESKKPTHFSIVTNDRPYNFATTGDAGNFSSVCILINSNEFILLHNIT